MLTDLLPVLFGFIAGAIVTGVFLYLVMRQQREKAANEIRVRTAVMESRLETQGRELEEAEEQLQQTRQKLEDRAEALQKALVSEASLQSRVTEFEREVEQLGKRLEAGGTRSDQLAAENSGLRQKVSELETRLGEQQKQNEEKLALLEQTREKMNQEFKTLAHEIFESKQQVFQSASKAQLDSLLNPLKERIKDFEKRVETSYNEETKERHSLIREIRNLQELNTRMSNDAINLTNALKGESKTQGTWGELILERVLENSGLEKGREYEIQMSLTSEDGRRYQPDVIIHLPEDKDIIIDSKVSLTAYERYCSAVDEAEKAEALKLHIHSMRQHIRQLGEKDYHKLEGIRTLDFVLLFVPVEAAFSLAVQEDNELFTTAANRNIGLVAPSTLLATLRIIQNIWRYEQQNRNAEEIAERAGRLYDKFVNFVGDLENIGQKLDSTRTAWEAAHNKLTSGKGNLIGRAEGMRQLGAKVSKSLPANLVELAGQENKAIEPPSSVKKK